MVSGSDLSPFSLMFNILSLVSKPMDLGSEESIFLTRIKEVSEVSRPMEAGSAMR